MKLIVIYRSDCSDECNPNLNVHCLEYESAEAFLVHFDEKAQECLDRWHEWDKTRDIKNPACPTFEIAGSKFYFWNFCRYVDGSRSNGWQGYYTQPTSPEVYELNEFFDKFKGQQLC
jgi:hypothetical protein